MNRKQLFKAIKLKRSFLCVGLDSDINKIPKHLLSYEDPIFEFNRQIIDSTHKYTVAYKPNLAFYESMGASGWVSLGKTVEHIRKVSPEVIIIADAKRGDIGNTSALYAKTFFETYDFIMNIPDLCQILRGKASRMLMLGDAEQKLIISIVD